MEPLPQNEVITRAAIWIALSCYFAARISELKPNAASLITTRRLWTAGCAAYLIHVACAFQFYHDWSHYAALEDTARQTDDVTGWNWGGGLWFNYLFTLAWIADVARLWRKPKPPNNRPSPLIIVWRGFFFFMVFNATVVFETGPVRWLGALGCLVIAWLWLQKRGRRVA